MQESNCCNDIRLIAAVVVVISHSFMLSGGDNLHEPVFWFSGGQVTAGGLAVFTFMVISGYLITRSFEHAASVWRFIVARAARILPALGAVLVLTAVFVGPWVTSLPLELYWRGFAPLIYVARNLSLMVYAEGLPGVLGDNPLPGVMNGSLWTLHIEAVCYALVVVLGVLRGLNRFVMTGLLLAGVVAMMLMPAVNYPVVLITHFLAGGALYQWRAPRSGRLAVVCAAAVVVSMLTGGFIVVSATAGAYAVFYLGFAPAFRGGTLTGASDLSYGTYIWAFPVQQLVVHMAGGRMTWYMNALISLPVILGLAWLSWHLIERRALTWKARLAHPARRPVEAVFEAPAPGDIAGTPGSRR